MPKQQQSQQHLLTDISPDLSKNSNPSSLLSNILNTGDLIEVIKSYLNIINNNEYTLQISGGILISPITPMNIFLA